MHLLLKFVLFSMCFTSFCVEAHVEIENVDLGPASPGQAIEQKIQVENLSSKEVSIVGQIAASWHDLEVTNLPITIPGNSIGFLMVEGKVARFQGLRNYALTLVTSEEEVLKLSIRIFVNSIFDASDRSIDLGAILTGDNTVRTIDLIAQDGSLPRLTAATDAGRILSVSAPNHKNRLTISVLPDASWGEHEGWVGAKTDSPRQPEVWIPYRVLVQGEVIPNVYQMNAGLIRRGDSERKVYFLLNSIGADPFKIGQISHAGADVEYKVEPCPSGPNSCQMIGVSIRGDNPFGQFRSQLSVDFPEFQRTMNLIVYGILIDKETQISDLAGLRGDNTASDTAALRSALEGITNESLPSISAPTPGGKGPLLKWLVRNEGSTYGYLVFRSSSEDGPWIRASSEIIRVAPMMSGRAVEYKWRDTTLDKPGNYWYRVELLDKHATRKTLTTAMRASFTDDANSDQ